MDKHPLHNLAMSEALKSSCEFRLGAVVFKGRKHILAVGHNHRRTHPLAKCIREDESEANTTHAELDALIGCRWYDSVQGASIFVARLRADGSAGTARPCDQCQNILRETGIKRMYYTTGNGDEFAMEKL